MAKAKRSPQRGNRSGNPARRAAGSVPPSGASSRPTAAADSPARATLNRLSQPALLWMHGLPRWLVPVAMGLFLVGGLFFGGSLAWLGTVLLVVVALFVAWLFALSWPVLSPGGRIARGLVLLGLIGAVYLKATGRL